MKRIKYSTQAWALTLTVALLMAFPANTFAANNDNKMSVRKGRTHGAFEKNNALGWQWVESRCTNSTIDVRCAQAAVLEASAECGDSAKFFKRGSETWKWIDFTLIVVSAASTAVGASATVANSKIWSTLGGTTGLGAVTTIVNSNVTADQNASFCS